MSWQQTVAGSNLKVNSDAEAAALKAIALLFLFLLCVLGTPGAPKGGTPTPEQA